MSNKLLLLVARDRETPEVVSEALGDEFTIQHQTDAVMTLQTYKRDQYHLIIIHDGSMVDAIYVARKIFEFERDQNIIIITENSKTKDIATQSGVIVLNESFNADILERAVASIFR